MLCQESTQQRLFSPKSRVTPMKYLNLETMPDDNREIATGSMALSYDIANMTSTISSKISTGFHGRPDTLPLLRQVSILLYSKACMKIVHGKVNHCHPRLLDKDMKTRPESSGSESATIWRATSVTFY